MPWTHTLAAFFAGAFLANAVPHFVHGISGDSFPTPFAKPPGRGLSSPPVNLLWAFFNLILGYLLFPTADILAGHRLPVLLAFAGAIILGLMLSIQFQKKLPR